MSEKLSFDKSIGKIELIFLYCGINVKSNQIRRYDRFKSTLVYILNFVCLNTDVLGAILWFITGLIDGKKFTEVTYVAPCVIASFLGDFKLIFLIIHKGKVRKLMDKLRCMEMNGNGRRGDVKNDLIAEKEINFLNAVTNALTVVNGSLIVMFTLSPLILMALKYAKTEELEFLLPLLILYPFNPHDVKIWPVIYFKQIWSVTIVILYICAADYLFYVFCTHLSIQFRLLRYNLEEIVLTRKNNNIHCDKFRGKLIHLIKWHQDLIESAYLLETIYTKSTLYNFVSSSIVICLTGFNAMAINDTTLAVTFLSFLFMSLSQIYFLCFFGDKLMKASMKVSDAVYNSKWYSMDQSFGKYLLIIQIRGQSPCKLTAWGFAEVNLRAFMKILSTAWSYFALLQTVYSSPNTS